MDYVSYADTTSKPGPGVICTPGSSSSHRHGCLKNPAVLKAWTAQPSRTMRVRISKPLGSCKAQLA